MDSLEQFNNLDAEAFETWLRAQFNALYRGAAQVRYRAFDFRDMGISRGESHLDGLHRLFRKLSDQGKTQFQIGLERILRNAKRNDIASEGMADVIKLIGLTKYHRAFPAFVTILGTGEWGENHPALIYDALSVLMMFEGSDDVYETAKGLATSRNFPDNLVFDAYLILARSRPERWRDDFSLLWRRFNNVHHTVEEAKDSNLTDQLDLRWKSLGHSLAKLPLSSLTSGLAVFANSDPSSADSWAIESLLKNMVFDEAAPLVAAWNLEVDEIVIADRLQPERMEVFSIERFSSASALVVRMMSKGGLSALASSFESLLEGNAPSIGHKASARLKNILGPRMSGRRRDTARAPVRTHE